MKRCVTGNKAGVGIMIFASVNEQNQPAWKLVLERRKTVTRRLKPLPVGSVFAVQPGRGMKAVCRARVKSCVRHSEWRHKYQGSMLEKFEARHEGFSSWAGLVAWFEAHKIDINKTQRIEFEKVV